MSGCNFFSLFDSPSGDTQLLSAAEACLDRGDYTCASRYYGLLSTSNSDEANAGAAFTLLDENGVGTKPFMQAILGGTTAGSIITQLINDLSYNSGASTRLSLFRAYQKCLLINNTRLQGLVRFITATALFSEILSEDAATPGNFKKSDLVSDPTTCLTTLSAPACNAPTGKTIVTGASPFSLDTATESTFAGTPTLYMLNAALTAINTGLNQIGTQGGVSSTLSGFSSTLTSSAVLLTIAPGTDSPVYRAFLIQNEIGSN